MNEHIKEIAVKAKVEHCISHVRLEDFAQLIVKECMNVLDPGEHQLIARFQARKWLAEHFGVEE